LTVFPILEPQVRIPQGNQTVTPDEPPLPTRIVFADSSWLIRSRCPTTTCSTVSSARPSVIFWAHTTPPMDWSPIGVWPARLAASQSSALRCLRTR